MQPTTEQLILVDGDDREVGTAEKIDAHRRGLLHRAFSVIIWDSAGRQLLQKRAATKYHSGRSHVDIDQCQVDTPICVQNEAVCGGVNFH